MMDIKETLSAELLYPSGNQLGENPLWDSARESIFWIDIEDKTLNKLTWPEKVFMRWILPERIGMVVQDEDNNLVLGLQNSLMLFDLNTCTIKWLMDIENDIPNNRPNDGMCDSKGRLWLGTMNIQAEKDLGSLYCINDSNIYKHLDNLTIANGKAWSLDNKYFYFTDSLTRKIDSYLFDDQLGTIDFYKTIIHVPEELGLPDGMTIDEEGMLWVAHWDGFCVCRWNPENGDLLSKIDLPVPKVSSCAFGGTDLDTLFITTAKTGLSLEDMEKYPLSGHLFMVKTKVKGLKTNLFNHIYV